MWAVLQQLKRITQEIFNVQGFIREGESMIDVEQIKRHLSTNRMPSSCKNKKLTLAATKFYKKWDTRSCIRKDTK
jgi:hypothetical protein